MKNYLKILRIAFKEGEIPLYLGRLFSEKGWLKTCDGSNAVAINYTLPFEGAVDFKVFEGILKKFPDIKMEQDDCDLLLSYENFKSTIVIDDIDFPDIPFIEPETVKITEDLFYTLKAAIKYAGKKYPYIYLANDHVFAADGSNMYYKEHSIELSEPIGINEKILSAIVPGCRVGTMEENTIVIYDFGYVIFTIDKLEGYPNAFQFMKESRTDKKLCNVASIVDAVGKLLPILINEGEKTILLNNKDNILTVEAIATDGSSKITFESDLEEQVDMIISPTFLQRMGYDFNVYISDDYLYLKNPSGVEIILMRYS